MSDNNIRKGKHLTVSDRMFIEDALNSQLTLNEIAKRLAKDPTTISKEIKRNRMDCGIRMKKEFVTCENRKGCCKMYICSESCNHLCQKCKTRNCYRICPDYKPKACITLNRFPHVCNGCQSCTVCNLRRYQYKAKVADANYKDTLSTARQGADITPKELEHLDGLISPLILRGQSLTHIYQNHKAEIGCTVRTLYNYVDNQMLTIKNIDLPRKVRYKPRKKRRDPELKDQKYKEGRRFEDFISYTEEYPEIPIVEMDTVHGGRGGKVLLTMFFRSCSLMIAFIMEECTQVCVKNTIDSLYEALGEEKFRLLFPLILTDNGSEFKAPGELEYDGNGTARTKVCYCDPLASYQKARLEKNHEYIRYVLPKGKSFKDLTQEDVTLMVNHINSTARASRNGCNPYQLAQMLLDNVLLEKLSLKLIQSDKVLLKPDLLKKVE
jgi:IS30 family transposase